MGVEFWRLDEVPGAERPDLWEELLSETHLPWSVRVPRGRQDPDYKAMVRPFLDDPELNKTLHDLSPWPHLGTAQDVGKLALYLASDDAEMVTGSMQVLDGGYTAG
jgi:NAD(P)-dependent dehydrogenase (short-subunit alcohol dehydrogenase family)